MPPGANVRTVSAVSTTSAASIATTSESVTPPCPRCGCVPPALGLGAQLDLAEVELRRRPGQRHLHDGTNPTPRRLTLTGCIRAGVATRLAVIVPTVVGWNTTWTVVASCGASDSGPTRRAGTRTRPSRSRTGS